MHVGHRWSWKTMFAMAGVWGILAGAGSAQAGMISVAFDHTGDASP